MPRQFDLHRQNAQATNNPNNQIAMGAIQKLVGQSQPNLAQLMEKILVDAIINLLTQIDTVTGLNILGFATKLKTIFGDVGDVLDTMLDNIPFIGPLLQAISGSDSTGGGGLTGIEHFFVDLIGILGAPSGLGSGSPVLSALGSTPLLQPVQNLVDAVHQAVQGGSSTGNAVSDVKTQLQNVFNTLFGSSALGTLLQTSVIPNITRTMSTDIQAIIDAVHQAVNGGSSTGNTTADIKTQLQSVFTNLFGSSALGTVLQTSVIPNITRTMSTDLQTVIDGIHQAVNGGSSTGNTSADVKTQIQAVFTNLFGSSALGTLLQQSVIPSLTSGWGNTIAYQNIVNVLGNSNLGADVQAIVDKVANGLGQSGTGHTLTNIVTYLGAIPSGNIAAVLGSANLGADIQAVVDKLANAFGQSGTGHTLANLLAYAEAIPGTNIASALSQSVIPSLTSGWGNTIAYQNVVNVLGSANLGADLQAVVDKIANALGNSGTGHTLANLLSYMGTIPYGNVTAVLGSASLGADIQAVVDKIANAMGQSGTGHTLANLLSYLEAIPGSNLTGSVAASLISGVTTNEQAIADAVYQATHGGSTTGNAISTIKTSLLAIPNANIAAILGGASLGADVQAVVDKISNAVGQSGTGHTLANLLSYLGSIPSGNIVNVLGGTNLGADVQAIVDKVSNGLGQSGTGHTLANLLSYLGAIPNTNVTAAAGSANLGADVQAVIDNIHNAVNALSTSGNAVTTIATDIAAIPSGIANVINSLTGNQSQSTANTAVGTLNSTLQANTVAISAINTKLSGSTSNSGGLSATVNFSAYSNSTSLPAIFTETYTAGAGHGTLGTTSGLAAWTPAGSSSNNATALYNVANTTTDYQVVTGTFAGAPGGAGQVTTLFARVNSAGTSYVRADIQTGSVTLTAVVSGSGTQFFSVSSTFNPSATYSLVCGNPSTSTIRQYQVLCNGTVVSSYTDSGAVSQVGSSFRGSGFGMSSGGPLAPAPISQWTVNDNAPAAQVGSGFRQYRASTTPVTVSGSAGPVSGWNDGLIASSFFDTSQQQTSDLTYASGTNNKITVSIAGWYAVSISALVAVTGSTSGFCFVLYRNGSSADRDVAINNAAFTGVWRGKFQVYCAAGDTLQPGISYFGTAPTIKGDAGGTTTAFEVCLTNCGTLS